LAVKTLENESVQKTIEVAQSGISFFKCLKTDIMPVLENDTLQSALQLLLISPQWAEFENKINKILQMATNVIFIFLFILFGMLTFAIKIHI
jgi:hypothetical protein